MATKADEAARQLCEAMWHYVEKRQELDEALAAYSGYSPSWALAEQFNAREHAERAVASALVDAVRAITNPED